MSPIQFYFDPVYLDTDTINWGSPSQQLMLFLVHIYFWQIIYKCSPLTPPHFHFFWGGRVLKTGNNSFIPFPVFFLLFCILGDYHLIITYFSFLFPSKTSFILLFCSLTNLCSPLPLIVFAFTTCLSWLIIVTVHMISRLIFCTGQLVDVFLSKECYRSGVQVPSLAYNALCSVDNCSAFLCPVWCSLVSSLFSSYYSGHVGEIYVYAFWYYSD